MGGGSNTRQILVVFRATRVRDVMDETFGKGKKLIKKKWKLDGTGIAEGNITAYIKRTGCVYLWDI